MNTEQVKSSKPVFKKVSIARFKTKEMKTGDIIVGRFHAIVLKNILDKKTGELKPVEYIQAYLSNDKGETFNDNLTQFAMGTALKNTWADALIEQGQMFMIERGADIDTGNIQPMKEFFVYKGA